MKRILLTTTSLVLAAGVAQAEVTFSGKAEAGVSRTEKTAATAAVIGRAAAATAVNNTAGTSVVGVEYDSTTKALGAVAPTATSTFATTGPSAELIANKKAQIAEQIRLALEDEAAAQVHRAATSSAANVGLYVIDADLATAHRAEAARLTKELEVMTGTAAVAAVAAGDMVAYSGYDMNVAVSSTLDNGMELSAAFDMGAGSIADRDDDRVLDAQAAAVALSTVTIKNGGVTYVIGNNEIDDLYDDTQNGDVSVAGAMGGISYTLVADLDKDTKEVKASTVYTVNADTAVTAVIGDVDTLVVTDAVAAVYESTSLKLSGAAGGLDWTFTTTNKNDRGNAASKVSLGYAMGDALSFTLTHDTQGKREAINTLKATYTMDAITLTVSGADDKNHAGNTNTGGKASQNMTIAYANGPLTASFNNDESSAWWATTSYDLGNGADLFATVDHEEFAVVGLTFAF